MAGPLTAGELAAVVGGRLQGDAGRRLRGLASLEEAGPEELSFLARDGYRSRAVASEAGCLLVGPTEELPGRDLIRCEDPYRAFALAMAAFHPTLRPPPGLSPGSHVSSEAELGEEVHVAPGVVVEAGAVIGRGAVLMAGSVVGTACRVGADCVLHPHVVLYPGTIIGERVVVHANAVLGSDGFGYASGPEGHLKIPHAGRVVVEDDVEIGAGSCIDRAVMGETRIGAGTKIDNLVQVGHNVRIGASSLLVSQSGISGSTTLGRGCVVAGQSGIAGHLVLGDGARVGAKSAVYEDVAAGSTVTGIPAIAHEQWRRLAASLGRLPELLRRVRRLEKENEVGDE